MASKRKFKKDLNKMVFEVVEECFSVNELTSKIQKAKTTKDFPAIKTEVEDAAVEYIHKLNDLM